jgi:hypothetical protein
MLVDPGRLRMPEPRCGSPCARQRSVHAHPLEPSFRRPSPRPPSAPERPPPPPDGLDIGDGDAGQRRLRASPSGPRAMHQAQGASRASSSVTHGTRASAWFHSSVECRPAFKAEPTPPKGVAPTPLAQRGDWLPHAFKRRGSGSALKRRSTSRHARRAFGIECVFPLPR